MANENKKITLATFKSFVKKAFAEGNLYQMTESRFDGMTDCVEYAKNTSFSKVKHINIEEDHTLGICGVWLVYGSRDSFTAFDKDDFEGIHLYNCCGSCTIARKK